MAKIFTFKNKRTMPAWLAWLLACFLKAYGFLVRMAIDDPGNHLEAYLGDTPRPCILAFWHNRLIFAPALFPKRFRKHITCLISASRDGEYMTKIVRFFSLNVVRGSSSRGGAQALLGLRGAIDAGMSPLLTVDGPRGPMYCVHSGAAALAQSSDIPVIPLILNYSRYWRLKSWDRMQIPKPFSNGIFSVGDPIVIPRTMAVEEANELIRQRMLDLTKDN